MKVLVTTVPFGETNTLPLEMLNSIDVDYVLNPLEKKLTEDELIQLVPDVDVIIAGTEQISARVIAHAPNLKLISRVGIGLDGVDLLAARDKDIRVSYTPDAPAPAVAELTIGLMISLLRCIHTSNLRMHQGEWKRFFGKRIAECTIGIIGVGRIGARVINRMSAFGTPRLLVNDVAPDQALSRKFKLEWVDKETIYKEADLISLHVPLTRATKNLVSSAELAMMKSDSLLINTCRGGVINEKELYDALVRGEIGGAAIDVYDREPYDGPLAELDSCLLTAHMGSMSFDCRTRMEIEATEEVIRFVKGQPLASQVPGFEYDIQAEGL